MTREKLDKANQLNSQLEKLLQSRKDIKQVTVREFIAKGENNNIISPVAPHEVLNPAIEFDVVATMEAVRAAVLPLLEERITALEAELSAL